MQQTSELHLVLRGVDGGSGNSQARTELARILQLEDRIVGSIIDRAPIILLRDVGADEARLAEDGLSQLGRAGISVELTDDTTGLPKVNWPTQPRMSELFPVARESSPELQGLLDRITHLEGRVAELEATVGLTPSAAPVAAAPAPAASPARAPAAPAAPARRLPPMPAGPIDAVPALSGELYWAAADVADAIPFVETGDNGRAPAGGAAIEEEVVPLAPAGDDLVELEPLDLADDLGPGEELQPLDALEPLEPLAPAGDDAIELAPLEPLGGGDEEEELEPWTGRARDYKSEAKAKDDDDDLEPWSGRARDYVPDSKRQKRPDPADDVEDLPELDLGDDDDPPIVAPTIPPSRQMPADDLPELEPVLGDEGVKRKKPAKKVAKKAAKKAPAKKAPAKKQAAGGAGGYSVFLSKIAGAAKKQAAIELLCDIKGIDEDDAAALCGKMIIPVAQGVSKEEAEDILGQFAAHKIQGRITRKKK